MKNKKTIPLSSILIILLFIAIVIMIYAGNGKAAMMMITAVTLGIVYWKWPSVQSARGQSEYAKGNNSKALSLLKKAHESSRSKVYHSTAYAYVLLRVGEADEAAKVLNYVLLNQKLKEQEKMQARQILSLVHYKKGDFAEATRLMEMVFEKYKNSSVYGALGYYKILSKSPDAVEFNEEAYEYNSDDKIIIDNMVIISLENGDLKKAKELSDKSINAGNKGVEIFYHAGETYLALGDEEQALQYFRSALSCERSFMTTISEMEITRAIESLENKQRA